MLRQLNSLIVEHLAVRLSVVADAVVRLSNTSSHGKACEGGQEVVSDREDTRGSVRDNLVSSSLPFVSARPIKRRGSQGTLVWRITLIAAYFLH